MKIRLNDPVSIPLQAPLPWWVFPFQFCHIFQWKWWMKVIVGCWKAASTASQRKWWKLAWGHWGWMLSWQRKRLQNHKQQSYDAHTSLEDLPAGGTGSLKSMCVHLKTAQTVNSTRQNRDLSLLRRTTILSTVMQGEREITSKSKAGVCELWKYQLQDFLSGGQDAKGPACNKLVFRGLMGGKRLRWAASTASPRERFVRWVTSSTGGDGHGWTAWQVEFGLPELHPKWRKESVWSATADAFCSQVGRGRWCDSDSGTAALESPAVLLGCTQHVAQDSAASGRRSGLALGQEIQCPGISGPCHDPFQEWPDVPSKGTFSVSSLVSPAELL